MATKTTETVACTWCGEDAHAGSHNYCVTATCTWCGEATAAVSHADCGDTVGCTWCGEASDRDHSLCTTGS